jgi:cytochrome P450
LRYEDVNALLRDRRLGRTYRHLASHAEMGHADPPEWHAPFWDLINTGIQDMEPPNHTRVRRLVSKAFIPRFVEGLRPRVQAILDGLVDGLDGASEIDLLRVAEPLPVTVIAEMLGVPETDRHHLRPWSADICTMYELTRRPRCSTTRPRTCASSRANASGTRARISSRSSRSRSTRASG